MAKGARPWRRFSGPGSAAAAPGCGGSGSGAGMAGHCPCHSPFSRDRPCGRFPRCPGPCACFPQGGRGRQGSCRPTSTRVTCRSRHRGERRRGWLSSLRGSLAAFPLLLKTTMVGGDGGGSSGQEVPGAAAQPSPARRGLSGRRRCSGIGSNRHQRMSPAEGKTKAASKDRAAEFGKAPKDTN